MTKQTKRLDIMDLPRDPQHFQGRLRTELVKMANYVRKYPNKVDFLVNTLEAVINHVNENKAIQEGLKVDKVELTIVEQLTAKRDAVTKLPNKAAVIEQASKLGLELTDEPTRKELDEALIARFDEIIKVQTDKQGEE